MITLKQRGFTLIELLVVVAIIGILSTIVFASLSTARNKAKDAAVQTELKNVQVQAELYYSSNGNSYGTAGTTCTATGSVFENADVARLITRIESDNGTSGTLTCANDATAWAISTELPSNPTALFFCVDSAGRAELTTTEYTISDYECD